MCADRAVASVDEYVAAASDEVRPILEEIRRIVERVVPGAESTFSYRMPAFRAGGRVFMYYAAFKHHIGVFPPVEGDEALMGDLRPYLGPKGNLRFPLSESVPYGLIERVVGALARQGLSGA